MFSGLLFRGLNLDFLSTHHIVNELAYRNTFRGGENTFPSLGDIQKYSGALGPDGAWWRGRTPDSQHVFNPHTGEGNALITVGEYYDQLVSHHAEGDFDGSAKAAAFLSHYIVDALDPAHHVGFQKSGHPVYDWHDPFFTRSSFSLLRNLLQRHFFFEICSGYYLWMKKKWYLRRFFSVKRHGNKFQLLRSLRRRVRSIHRLDMYENFFHADKRRQNHAKRQILFLLFPLMISSVGRFWWCAWRDAHRLRFPAFGKHNRQSMFSVPKPSLK